MNQMSQKIPTEAMSMEEFERWERGLPPLPKKKAAIPEPEPPKIENELSIQEIDKDNLLRASTKREVVQNRGGARFIGYRATLEFSTPAGKKGEPSGASVLQGWINEAEFMKLRKLCEAKKIDTDELDL